MTRYTRPIRVAKLRAIADITCSINTKIRRDDIYVHRAKAFTRDKSIQFILPTATLMDSIIILDGKNLLLTTRLRKLGWTGVIVVIEHDRNTYEHQIKVNLENKLDAIIEFGSMIDHLTLHPRQYKFAIMDFMCTLPTAESTIWQWAEFAPIGSKLVIVTSTRSARSSLERDIDYLIDSMPRESSIEGVIRYQNEGNMACTFLTMDNLYHDNWEDVRIEQHGGSARIKNIYTNETQPLY